MLVVATVMLGGCQQRDGLWSSEEKPTGAKLNRSEALAQALKAPQLSKTDFANCDEPRVSYYKPSRHWSVLITCRPYTPGGHIFVTVDDTTGRIEVHPGA